MSQSTAKWLPLRKTKSATLGWMSLEPISFLQLKWRKRSPLTWTLKRSGVRWIWWPRVPLTGTSGSSTSHSVAVTVDCWENPSTRVNSHSVTDSVRTRTGDSRSAVTTIEVNGETTIMRWTGAVKMIPPEQKYPGLFRTLIYVIIQSSVPVTVFPEILNTVQAMNTDFSYAACTICVMTMSTGNAWESVRIRVSMSIKRISKRLH